MAAAAAKTVLIDVSLKCYLAPPFLEAVHSMCSAAANIY
jgi:hypothetical protein